MMDIDSVNKSSLIRSLNFHGIQLQKIFETEYSNFSNLQLDSHLHFNEYTRRQKQLSFQDRGKRFRLQQFICKHVNKLFTRSAKIREDASRSGQVDPTYYPVLPPLEWFLTVDKEMRLQRFFEYVKKGDIIVSTIVGKTAAGLILKILYGECDEIRCVSDVGIKAFVPTSALIPAVDKPSTSTRAFLINDSVCCEVLEVCTDTEKIVGGMKGILCQPENRERLGLIHTNDFPLVFKKFQEKKNNTYGDLLEKSDSFNNPNLVDNLLSYLNIPNELYSFHEYLKTKFPEKEYASELRQVQAAKWSFHSVTEGIEHFKEGRYTEAFQCLNRALTIDPRNIEALVARGALYANSGNYEKAIVDFENALKFNPNHQNAKKYLGDTLIAYGRTHEENGKFSDAVKAYEYCLSLVPNHEEGRNSLQYIKKKLQAASKKETEDTLVDLKKIRDINNTLSQLLTQTVHTDDKQHLMREMKKLKMKKRESSSSSSSSSSESSSDSSEDSSSSSESTTRVKKKKSRSKKESSLSPLSKRAALMGNAAIRESFQLLPLNSAIYNPPSVSYTAEDIGSYYTAVDNENEYELRVRKFLEETKKDDDYEDKVRKFLDETAKWKKKQKMKEEKSKKRKKEKKSKSKKKKKDSKRKKKHTKESKKRKHRSTADSNDEISLPEKCLGLSSLKDLEELQSRLSAYYSKVEKTSKSKKEKHSREKRSHQSKRKTSDSESSSDEVEKRQRSSERKKAVDLEDETNEIDRREAQLTPVAVAKPEMQAIKFKMQVPSTATKLQKRSSIEHVWEDEKMESEDEETTDIPLPAQKSDRKEFNGRSVPSIEPITPRELETPPRMDKLGGFHIKKSPSRRRNRFSPSRHSSKSMSRSRSRSRSSGKRDGRHQSRSSSRKRFRHSRSRSNADSPVRGKYSRYSRSRSYSRSKSRSRSRSPYYRHRVYLRGRGGGTYYKPRIQNFRGGYRQNWRYNNYNNNYGDRRNRNFNPNYRFNNQYRPYNRDYNNKYRNDRDYRSRHSRRSHSDDERGSWRDDSKERMERKHSDSSGGSQDGRQENATYEEFAQVPEPAAPQQPPEPEVEKPVA